jgi:hypothetical protein
LSYANWKLVGDIDTGSTLIALPKAAADLYYSKVPGYTFDQQAYTRFGGYVFPCEAQLPDFSIFVSGQKRTGKFPLCWVSRTLSSWTHCTRQNIAN